MLGPISSATATAYTDGDEVYDTPSTKVTSDLGNLLGINTCNETNAPYQNYTTVPSHTLADQPDQLENFMCYSDDDKMNTFTNFQAQRMWGSLSGSYGVGQRTNLVSPANLTARGVSTCNAYTGIVSGVFNYALSSTSTCTSVVMQFTNPNTSGFNSPPTTTYSWTFGDGGTSISVNPSHTYTTQSSFTVTCVATNTMHTPTTNSYSTVISTNFNVHIVGQSSQQAGALSCTVCPANTTTATVCRGAEQTIFVWFDVNVPSATITDGTNNYVVKNYMNLSQPEVIPYLITATNTATYSISPATCNGVFNGSATFNVIDCCPTMITNGDFESTYTTTPTYGFATDLFYTTTPVNISGVQQFGDYDVNTLGAGYFGPYYPFDSPSSFQNATGKVLQIDGFEGNNSIVNIPAGCGEGVAPRIWQETITGLLPNTPYFYSFKVMENYGNTLGCLLNFQTSIASNTLTLLPTQTFTPTVDYTRSPLMIDWTVYTYSFTTPPTVTTSNTFSVTINQVNNFEGSDYDILMDNITLNQMTPGLQAIGNATICAEGTHSPPLGTQVNCADPTQYTFAWTPTVSVSCPTCSVTIAHPTATTVYTLVAVPTNTLGGLLPSYVSTVTVTLASAPPFSIIASSTTLCPGITSATLTAGGSGANNYIWTPGGATTNSIVVTPTVTTTYTLSGEGIGKCTATPATITININNTPTTISVTPTSTALCSSNTSATLTASGATTYTWMPAFNITGSSNTYSVTASPPTNTTFTVMGTNNGCVGTNTVAVSIVPGPVLTFTAIPSSSICIGQTATLTVGGASTYSWSTGATTPSIVVTPTVPTNYSIEGISTSGCPAFNNIPIIVNTYPTLTVTAAPTSVCVGQQVNMAVGTAVSYSWSPAASLNSTSNNSVIATPYSTTTYTVVGANGNCPTTQTVAITVTTSSCTGTPPVSYNLTGTNTYSTTPLLINANSNLLINTGGNITFTNTEMRIAPNATITVAPSATLTISGSWLHACAGCTGSMWEGIIVENGGVLVVNNSYIEDALKAVYTSASSTTTPIPSYTVTNSILNKNIYGIYVDSHQGNLSGNTVYNTVFTCRSLSSHTTANLGSIKTNIAAATPLIPSTSNPLATPLNLTSPQDGIYVNAVNVANPVNVGVTTQTYNLFDNLRFGIRVAASSITVENNYFQNLVGNNTNGTLFGVGVFLDATTFRVFSVRSVLTIGNNTTAGKNYFTNCLIGVYTNRVHEAYINDNTFNNETTATTFSGTPTTGQYGVFQTAFGFGASGSDFENMQFENNTCQNYATGYWSDFGKPYNTGHNASYFYNNVMNGAGTGTQYMNYGIYLQQSTPSTNTVVPQDNMWVTANTITNVNTSCVSVNSVNTSTVSGFLTISQNTELSVKPNTYTVIQNPRVAAVRVSGSYLTHVNDNTNIRCTGLTGTVTPTQYQAGIYVTQSPNSFVCCNTISNIGEDIVFEGTSITYNNNMSRNNFDYSKYGFVLRNGGIIGDQGGSTFPHDNIWTISTHFTDHTLADNSNPSASPTSKLYCRTATCTGSTTYLPCANTYTNLGTPYVTGTTLISTTGSSSQHCASDGGGGGGGGRMAAPGINNNTDTAYYQNIQNSIRNTTNRYPVYDVETRWALQHYLSSANPYMLAATGYENAQAFAMVDAKLADENYTAAQSLLNSIQPTNVIEQNWLTVSNIIIKQQNNNALTNADVNALQHVAEQCYLTGGNIVWRARAILDCYYKTILNYPDLCVANNSIARLNAATSGIENPYTNQLVNFYPNPNNGKMTFEYTITNDASLEISDLNGRLVGTYFLPAYNNVAEVRNEDLKNGIYMYRVISNGIVIKIGKIIIMQ